VQARLPGHEFYQGNCGGRTEAEVLAWYGIREGDNGE
jgi:phenol hydroxylase P3 protein